MACISKRSIRHFPLSFFQTSDATPGSAAAAAAAAAASKIPKRKFSSFFKSLVIELDKELYGPDNHLVEWHRTNTTQETDGFQVRERCEKNRCG